MDVDQFIEDASNIHGGTFVQQATSARVYYPGNDYPFYSLEMTCLVGTTLNVDRQSSDSKKLGLLVLAFGSCKVNIQIKKAMLVQLCILAENETLPPVLVLEIFFLVSINLLYEFGKWSKPKPLYSVPHETQQSARFWFESNRSTKCPMPPKVVLKRLEHYVIPLDGDDSSTASDIDSADSEDIPVANVKQKKIQTEKTKRIASKTKKRKANCNKKVYQKKGPPKKPRTKKKPNTKKTPASQMNNNQLNLDNYKKIHSKLLDDQMKAYKVDFDRRAKVALADLVKRTKATDIVNKQTKAHQLQHSRAIQNLEISIAKNQKALLKHSTDNKTMHVNELKEMKTDLRKNQNWLATSWASSAEENTKNQKDSTTQMTRIENQQIVFNTQQDSYHNEMKATLKEETTEQRCVLEKNLEKTLDNVLNLRLRDTLDPLLKELQSQREQMQKLHLQNREMVLQLLMQRNMGAPQPHTLSSTNGQFASPQLGNQTQLTPNNLFNGQMQIPQTPGQQVNQLHLQNGTGQYPNQNAQ